MALENNHYLKIKQMQINEKKEKINEDKVKLYPDISVGANYQYNTNLPKISIAEGSFGTLPPALGGAGLPATDQTIVMGNNNTYNAGASFYQPISQVSKIKTGIEISKMELVITESEKVKASMQIKQTAEKLYYSLLILEKQKEEAELKKAAAQSKLKDAQSAVMAGKVTNSTQVGLNASVADEEQNLLKIKIQEDDYTADLKQLVGLPDSVSIIAEPLTDETEQFPKSLYDSLLNNSAAPNNVDIKIAGLTVTKSESAIKASQYSYRPDFGILGGYAFQKGNALYPTDYEFIGFTFKWDIQDIFSNNHAKQQRIWQKKQAEEDMANTKEQVNTDIAKANRKIYQSIELITVAEKAVNYRREDLKIEADKQLSGLNLESDYLSAKAALAKAESDLYAAKLNYRLALTDLQILTGKY